MLVELDTSRTERRDDSCLALYMYDSDWENQSERVIVRSLL